MCWSWQTNTTVKKIRDTAQENVSKGCVQGGILGDCTNTSCLCSPDNFWSSNPDQIWPPWSSWSPNTDHNQGGGAQPIKTWYKGVLGGGLQQGGGTLILTMMMIILKKMTKVITGILRHRHPGKACFTWFACVFLLLGRELKDPGYKISWILICFTWYTLCIDIVYWHCAIVHCLMFLFSGWELCRAWRSRRSLVRGGGGGKDGQLARRCSWH